MLARMRFPLAGAVVGVLFILTTAGPAGAVRPDPKKAPPGKKPAAKKAAKKPAKKAGTKRKKR